MIGFEGRYLVSDYGRVKTLLGRTPKTMRGYVRKPDRHVVVTLTGGDGQKPKIARVHRLVLEAFVGPCPDGMEGCHNDGVPTRNHLGNLRWDTQSENMYDRVRHGVHAHARKTHCPRGHEYTPENTYQPPGKGRINRVCRECTRDKAARKAIGNKQVDRTHCPKGHPYVGDNLIVRRGGDARGCRECQNIANREYRARKTHCPKGHALPPLPAGRKRRVCKTCRAKPRDVPQTSGR